MVKVTKRTRNANEVYSVLLNLLMDRANCAAYIFFVHACSQMEQWKCTAIGRVDVRNINLRVNFACLTQMNIRFGSATVLELACLYRREHLIQ